MVVPFGSADERRSRTTYRPTATPEGSTHVDTAFTGTTSSFSGTAFGKLAAGVVARQRVLGGWLLDQFATGLVGTRSPHGAVRTVSDPQYVSGGFSSGSAVSVALGRADFALGTDDAGIGPGAADFNGRDVSSRHFSSDGPAVADRRTRAEQLGELKGLGRGLPG
jgi:allophanate hydrolase